MVKETYLRAKIRADLPPEAFQPQPLSGLLFIPLIGLVVAGIWAVVAFPLPWYFALVVSFLVGNFYATLWFLGHECLHGSVFRSAWAKELGAFCGAFIFCYSPALLRAWHLTHHQNTNVPGNDGDSVNLQNYSQCVRPSFLGKLFPTCLPYNLLYMALGNTLGAQGILWVQSRYVPGLKKMKKNLRAFESFLIVSFWVTLALFFGARGALFGIFLPMIFANFVWASYAATNHQLRAQSDKISVLDTTVSLKTFSWIELIHLNVSCHTEHHLFPTMNWRFYPLVRKSLLKHAKDSYMAPPRWKALWAFLQTPHVYRDPHTLINPANGKTIEIKQVEAWLGT